jgi:MFS family permease
MALVEFVGLAAMAFLPTLLIESHDLAPETANTLFAVFFATATVTQPLAGWISDRHGRDRTIARLAAIGALGYGGLAVTGPLYVATVAAVLAGGSMSAAPVIQSRMLDGFGIDERGTGFGAFPTVYLLLGATGTGVVGAVADAASWTEAFGLLSSLFVTLLLVTAIVSLGDVKGDSTA